VTDPAVDVFVSYKREDRPRVAPLVESLRTAGFNVWWDADIPGGATWRAELLRWLDSARCVIVVWSERSVSGLGDFVIEEAERARQRRVLLPIRIDRVSPPIGFGQIQTVDVIDWDGDRDDSRLVDVAEAVKSIASGRSRRYGAPAIRRRGRQLAGAAAIGAPLIAFGLNVADLQSTVCAVPGVNAACRELGLGNVASRSQKAAWLMRPAGDCDWLRTLLASEPKGPYASEALARLQARHTVTEESWRAEARRVPLFVRMSATPLPSREAAENDALARGEKDARALCAGYQGELFRLRSATVDRDSVEWRCETRGGAVRCSADAQAVCEIEARHTIAKDVCE
jgi:TIR domain-containing protein